MMQLPCPYCGLRDESEFEFGGLANIHRPTPPEKISDDEWASYLFEQRQTAGWQAERWVHTYGCREWFTIWRHSVTHQVGTAAPENAPLPETPK